MPSRMSFSMSAQAVRDRSKTVTRRLGWGRLAPGKRFVGIEKGMGLRRGEHQVVIAHCFCVSNTPEPLSVLLDPANREYARAEMIREGFPDLAPEEFVAMFVRHNRIDIHVPVNRIEFGYLDVTP
jgi:hypothetical protein